MNVLIALESEYPGVTFVYMASYTQTEAPGVTTGTSGTCREFCSTNERYLFNFGDIDCWYGSDCHTYD